MSWKSGSNVPGSAMHVPHVLLITRAEKVGLCLMCSSICTLLGIIFLLCITVTNVLPHSMPFDALNVLALITLVLAMLSLLWPIYIIYRDHVGLESRTMYSHKDTVLILYALFAQFLTAVVMGSAWTSTVSYGGQVLLEVLLSLAVLALIGAMTFVFRRYTRWKMGSLKQEPMQLSYVDGLLLIGILIALIVCIWGCCVSNWTGFGVGLALLIVFVALFAVKKYRERQSREAAVAAVVAAHRLAEDQSIDAAKRLQREAVKANEDLIEQHILEFFGQHPEDGKGRYEQWLMEESPPDATVGNSRREASIRKHGVPGWPLYKLWRRYGGDRYPGAIDDEGRPY